LLLLPLGAIRRPIFILPARMLDGQFQPYIADTKWDKLWWRRQVNSRRGHAPQNVPLDAKICQNGENAFPPFWAAD
jgi:hypothetical protein